MEKRVCYKCPKRHIGCHDKCEDYQAERKEEDAKREKKRKERDLDNGYYAITIGNYVRKKR